MKSISILVICIAVSVVHAQPANNVEQARAHFKNGTEMYDENNFRGALIEFQRAYELSPSFKILFNIGQVYMELQDYAGALKAYARYLKEGGPDVPAERASEVNAEIERLKGRVGDVTVQTVAGAEILVDQVQVGFAPLPEPVVMNTGRHMVTVRPPGHEPVTRAIDVAGQQQLTVAIANDIAPSSVGKRDGEQQPPSKTPMYVAWAATGVLAITAAVFGVVAISDAKQLDTLRDTYPVTNEQLQEQADKQVLMSRVADGVAIAAVVAGGIALYLTFGRSYSTPDKKSAQLRVSPTGISLVGRF